MFEKNQYPPPYYEPIVENTISKKFTQKEQHDTDAELKESSEDHRCSWEATAAYLKERKKGMFHSVDGI